MQYRLRTLLIALAIAPPALWAAYRIGKPSILHEIRQWTRPVAPGRKDNGGEIYYYHPDDDK